MFQRYDDQGAVARASLLACLLFAAATFVGCKQSVEEPPPDADPAEVAAANAVLDAMIDVYREAESYRDEGNIEWDVQMRGRPSQHKRYAYALEFTRPNRLRLSFQPYGQGPVEIISDGQYVHGVPQDFFDQVVRFPAPSTIEVPAFYGVESLEGIAVPTVACSLVRGSIRQFGSLPLDLLAGSEPLKELRSRDDSPRLVEPMTIGDQRHDGIRFRVSQDDITLWINPKTRLLRRVQIAPVPSGRSSASHVIERMTVDFRKAEIDPPIDVSRYHWGPTGPEILVEKLVSPTGERVSGSPTSGMAMPNYAFIRGDGSQGDIQSLRGKFAVIDLWATHCGPCRIAMPKLDELRKKFADDPRVEFLALSLDDPTKKSLDDLRAKMEEWGAAMPFALLADVDAAILYRELQVGGIPTTLMLAPDGTIQYARTGYSEELPELWPKMIENLLSYDDRLAAVRIEDASQSVALPEVHLAQAKGPAHATLTKLWSNDRVATPGNILVIDEPGEPVRTFVVEGERTVVELDAAGEIVARHEDIVPKETAISVMRTGKTIDGKRLFVTTAVGQSQVFVFDDAWQLQFAYPSEPGVGNVYDVTVGRMKRDGPLEIFVGYFGPAGVHALDAAGKRRWRNRHVENVGDMAVVQGPGDEGGFVLCANQFGTLRPIDGEGQHLQTWRYRDRAVPYITAASSDPTKLCAISVDIHGNRVAVGLAVDGSVEWSYVLPAGSNQNLVDPITHLRAEGDQPLFWLMAAADGSVHWLDANGQGEDSFAPGYQVAGLAATRVAGVPVIMLSGPTGVTAWKLEPKAASE